MKIVDAFWEKRNLGVNVIEVTADKSDLKDKPLLLHKIQELLPQAEYLVLKVPVGDVALLHELQDMGFLFLECQYGLTKDISTYTATKEINLLESAFKCKFEIKQIKDETYLKEEIIKELEEEMFQTDRISLDPIWGAGTAVKRYSNWLFDLIKNDNVDIHLILMRNNSIGFYANSYLANDSVKCANGLLGGAFKRYQGTGLGMLIIHLSIVTAKEKGSSVFETSISSNNFGVMRVYSTLGFVVKSSSYVFRYYSRH